MCCLYHFCPSKCVIAGVSGIRKIYCKDFLSKENVNYISSVNVLLKIFFSRYLLKVHPRTKPSKVDLCEYLLFKNILTLTLHQGMWRRRKEGKVEKSMGIVPAGAGVQTTVC